MFQRLYRLRRRFIYLAITLLAWIVIGFAIDDPVFSVDNTAATLDNPVTWAAIVLSSVIVAVGAWLFFGIFAADFRHTVELSVLTIFLTWVVKILVPLAQGMDWLTFFAILVVVFRLLYGPILDARTLREMPVWSRTFRVDLSPEQVWAHMTPLPEHAESFFPPNTAIGREEDGRLLAIYPMRDGQMYQVERVSVQEVRAPEFFKATFEPAVMSAHSAGLSGMHTVRLEPDGDGTKVTLTEQRARTPFRRRLQWYLDDEFNDRCDSLIAFLDGRRDRSVFGMQLIRK